MRSRRRFADMLVHQWPVKVLSLAAAVFLFLFNRVSILQERYLGVPLEVRCPSEYVPASSYVKTARVTIKGEPSRISTIAAEDIVAFIDLGAVSAEGGYAGSVQIERLGSAAGVEPLELSVEPGEVLVELERKLVKLVPVRPRYSGRMEPGYDFVAEIEPPSVEVEGPRSLVEKVTEVATESIELSGKVADFSLAVKVPSITELLRVKGSGSVAFSAKVEKVDSLKTLDPLPIELRNLAPGLAVSGDPGTGSMRLQGGVMDLRDFQPLEALLYVDCADVTKPGTYRLPVRTKAPEKLSVIDYSPEELVLSFVEMTASAAGAAPGDGGGGGE